MLFQCWPSVFDAGPTLKQHCVNVPCSLGCWGCRCRWWHLIYHWPGSGTGQRWQGPSAHSLLPITPCLLHPPNILTPLLQTQRTRQGSLNTRRVNVFDAGPTFHQPSTNHFKPGKNKQKPLTIVFVNDECGPLQSRVWALIYYSWMLMVTEVQDRAATPAISVICQKGRNWCEQQRHVTRERFFGIGTRDGNLRSPSLGSSLPPPRRRLMCRASEAKWRLPLPNKGIAGTSATLSLRCVVFPVGGL